MRKDDLFIGTTDLKKCRGWTDALIKVFLGEPDKVGYYGRGFKRNLYSKDRVIAAEALKDFVIAKEWASKRSLVSLKVADAQRKDQLAEIANMIVTVTKLDDEALLRYAINSYNSNLFGHHNADTVLAAETSDKGFLERIQVNYIRHCLTKYDENLERVAGKVGIKEAIWEIRKKVYEAIAECYPKLAQECQRQLERCLNKYVLSLSP